MKDYSKMSLIELEKEREELLTGGITMELIKEFCYVVKQGIVCVEVFSMTENRWKYVSTDYFEKHCKLME